MLPLGNQLFWVGSSYEWDFNEKGPTAGFLDKTMIQLNDWLKIPFKLVDHVAALRPATLERRPFVGFHPLEPRVGIFNGMGTKGFSLAPYFARQFTNNIIAGDPIDPAADIQRFRKVLSQVIGVFTYSANNLLLNGIAGIRFLTFAGCRIRKCTSSPIDSEESKTCIFYSGFLKI